MSPKERSLLRFKTLTTIGQLALQHEWGTPDQIAHQNAFTGALERLVQTKQIHPRRWEQYETYCLKATVLDMVFEGLRMVAEQTL